MSDTNVEDRWQMIDGWVSLRLVCSGCSDVFSALWYRSITDVSEAVVSETRSEPDDLRATNTEAVPGSRRGSVSSKTMSDPGLPTERYEDEAARLANVTVSSVVVTAASKESC